MAEFYSVTQIADDLGVTPRALRFYENKGLIAPQRAGNSRVYTNRDRGRLMRILRGKRQGFTLSEVRAWLCRYDVDPDRPDRTTHRRDEVRARIDALEQQRRDRDATLAELREIPDQVARQLADRLAAPQ